LFAPRINEVSMKRTWFNARKTPSLGWTLVQGLFIGLAATQALDWLSTVLYENEDPKTRADEDRARGGLHAYERAIERAATARNVHLTRDQIAKWGWRFHKVFGVLGGVGYAALRRKNRSLGWGYGLGFGTAFFLIGDELMVPLSRLTPGPAAFSWKVHARGAAAHLAYGVAAESTARLLERAAR
jgi:putative membrane protein